MVIILACSTTAGAAECSYVNKEGAHLTIKSPMEATIKTPDGTVINCSLYGLGTGVPNSGVHCDDDGDNGGSVLFSVARTFNSKSEDIVIAREQAWYPTAGC